MFAVVELFSLAMSTLVIAPCLANWRTVCSHLQQQPTGLGLRSALPQQLGIRAIPLGNSPSSSRRGSVRGSKLSQRSLQAGPRADSEREERPNVSEGSVRRGLDELDNQLRTLSTSDRRISDAREARKGDEKKLAPEEGKKLDWPEFGDGFALYIGIGLILITVLNNILFRVFLGPPVRPPQSQGPEVGSEVPEATQGRRERYKLRSYNDPKYFTNAPPMSDQPTF